MLAPCNLISFFLTSLDFTVPNVLGSISFGLTGDARRCLINRANYHMNLMYRSPYPLLGVLIPEERMGCLLALLRAIENSESPPAITGTRLD